MDVCVAMIPLMFISLAPGGVHEIAETTSRSRAIDPCAPRPAPGPRVPQAEHGAASHACAPMAQAHT